VLSSPDNRQPAGYVLYIEEPGQCCSINVASDTSSAPFPSWSIQVSLQPVNGGPPVPLSTWQGITESYGITGHQGQAAMYFTIDHPGRYLLAIRNASPGSITDVAVGRGIGQGILIPFVLIVAGAFALLAYPGDNKVNSQAHARCDRAFTAYDGIPPDQSAYNYVYLPPDSSSWASGDRSVQCIAYEPSGAPLYSSIKGSNQ
jgi:hypothetical protein